MHSGAVFNRKLRKLVNRVVSLAQTFVMTITVRSRKSQLALRLIDVECKESFSFEGDVIIAFMNTS